MAPRLSLVILTRNEAQNIQACLESVAQQTDRRFEVILIDAASADGTVALARAAQGALRLPMRIVESERLIPIGEARNLGVQMAAADAVAFLSADAELDPAWTAHALQALQDHDMVFCRQVHAPHRWGVGASVRGLRYHYPTGAAGDPLALASNVAAAYQKRVLLAFPFDPAANAAEDILLAQRAARAGHTATYVPEMVVLHHDVSTWRQEMRKNVREGHGCATYSDELGLSKAWLAWAGLLAAAAAVGTRHRAGWGLFAAALWLPALRRAHRRRGQMPVAPMAMAVVASPMFDLAFLTLYLRGLLDRAPHSKEVTP